MSQAEIIFGRNSITEALKSGRSINKILVAAGDRQGSVKKILGQAREQKIVIQEVDPAKLKALVPEGSHQGIVAYVAPIQYSTLDDVLEIAKQRNEPPFLVILDELEDPHNVGAILRTADAAGCHGVLLPKRRTAPITATVAKTSAGAVEYVPIVRIGNVSQTIKTLKEEGIWIVGADMDGTSDYYAANMTGPIAVVVGSEGQGLSRLIKENCDFLVKIPMKGHLTSLNASVACSLLLYEVLKQRELN